MAERTRKITPPPAAVEKPAVAPAEELAGAIQTAQQERNRALSLRLRAEGAWLPEVLWEDTLRIQRALMPAAAGPTDTAGRGGAGRGEDE